MSDNINDNIKAEKESVLIFVSLAEEFFKNNSFDEAINYCKMALHQIPDLQEAKDLLSKCYEKTGNKNELAELQGEIKPSEPETVPAEDENKPGQNDIIEEEKNENEDERDFLNADQTESLLDNALTDINDIKGVLGSIIIEESGIIIREKTVKGLDAEIASALFSTIFYVSEEAIEKLNMGTIDRIFIEIGKVRVYLFKGNGYIIGIFTEEIVKIGLIHVRARQLLKNIKEVLGV